MTNKVTEASEKVTKAKKKTSEKVTKNSEKNVEKVVELLLPTSFRGTQISHQRKCSEICQTCMGLLCSRRKEINQKLRVKSQENFTDELLQRVQGQQSGPCGPSLSVSPCCQELHWKFIHDPNRHQED